MSSNIPKVAIALYGEYSKWWEKNNYEKHYSNIIIFKYILDHPDRHYLRDPHTKFFYDPPQHIHTKIPRINTEPQTVRRVLINDYCCQQLVNMIDDYEKQHNIVFDIKIFTTFRTILLNFPTKPNNYYTPYYSYVTLQFPNPLNCIEIVSNTHIRYNGGPLQQVHHLGLRERSILYKHLFDNRVFDFETFKTISSLSSSISIFTPSVINISGNPFDYANYRSVFTPKERLDQTSYQICSIKYYGDDSDRDDDIYDYDEYDEAKFDMVHFLLEGSELDLEQLEQLYRAGMDIYGNSKLYIILFSKDYHGNHYANEHANKSIYEIYVLQEMLNLKIHSKWYFKFGGRYQLLPHFNLPQFLQDKPVYKTIDASYTFGKQNIIECILYSFPKSYREKYIEIYKDIMERVQNTSEGIETLLYKNSPEFETVDILGIIGKDAIEAFDRIV
jgi:hypothetical protein